MAIYSYVITRDFGFAPNPFYGVCTLATCKPRIRRIAKVGDWVLGFGSAERGSAVASKMIYAMQVEAVRTFDEYWNSAEFARKKPIMNGSKMQNYGDNIYHHDENGEWIQENSHHSREGGVLEPKNLKKDTGTTDRVLISRKFWYWGGAAVALPASLQDLIHRGINHSEKEARLTAQLEAWLAQQPSAGRIGNPAKFSQEFARYDGN